MTIFYSQDNQDKYLEENIFKGYTEMISGIKDTFDERHNMRLLYENSIMGSTTELIKVKTLKLETILDKYNICHVNYLSDPYVKFYDIIKKLEFGNPFVEHIAKKTYVKTKSNLDNSEIENIEN